MICIFYFLASGCDLALFVLYLVIRVLGSQTNKLYITTLFNQNDIPWKYIVRLRKAIITEGRDSIILPVLLFEDQVNHHRQKNK